MSRARLISTCLVVAALLATGCSDDDASSKSTKRTTTTTSADDGSTTTTSTAPANPVLPAAVAVGQEADLDNGLFVTVKSVKPVPLEAHGPGDVAGPGVAVTLEVRNDTGKPADLGGMAINASYGGGTPASPNRGPVGSDFAGRLKPGGTATATYNFRVPADGTGSIVIDIHHAGTSNVVIVDVGSAVG